MALAENQRRAAAMTAAAAYSPMFDTEPQATSTATGINVDIKPKTEAVEPRMAELMRESGIDRSKVKTLLRRATGKPATGQK